jgi:carboxyl-terminal processing protease
MKSKTLHFRYLLGIPFLLILTFCDKKEEVPTTSNEATSYLNEIISIMEKNAIHRADINWQTFKIDVFDAAKGAKSIEETYPALRIALGGLHDNHSFIITKTKTSLYSANSSGLSCSEVIPSLPSIPQDIGYIKISQTSAQGADAVVFAEAIQTQIKSIDKASITGWLVDLRENRGGNMWPMVAGIGPVLGEGIVGHFIDPEGNISTWSYINGEAKSNDFVVTKISNPYTLLKPNPKVAVLTSNNTASSGEATAICFIGRSNTRSFGTATCGLSTANLGYQLSDGAMLYLTVSYMADRNKNKFGGTIAPDQVISNQNEAVQRAMAWIKE